MKWRNTNRWHEIALVILSICVGLFVAFLWFACDFGWANNPSFCGWTTEEGSYRWQIQSSGTPTLNTGPNMDHTGMTQTLTINKKYRNTDRSNLTNTFSIDLRTLIIISIIASVA